MKGRDAGDPRSLIALALVIASVAAAHAIRQLRTPALSLSSAELRVPLVLGLVLVVVVLVARGVSTRRALGRRVRLTLVATEAFDPGEEAVLRFAAGLTRSRRAVGDLLTTKAAAIRVQLDTDPEGRLRYTLTVPGHAVAAVRAAVAAYGDAVEIHDTPPTPVTGVGVCARAELVLARASRRPLRHTGLDPDPLTAFAHAITTNPDDRTVVCIDLHPPHPAQRARLRRRMSHDPHTSSPDLAELLAGTSRDRRPRHENDPGRVVRRRSEQRALTAKLADPEPLFRIQILLRTDAPTRALARERLRGLLACFDAFAGENHLKVSGLRLPGVTVLGSDMPWRRRRFDTRLHTGRFAPTRAGVVTASEICGLLKPPTAKCLAANVLRSGGTIPPAPVGLPEFTGQPDLLPLGHVRSRGERRLVGVPLESTFFSYMAGRSRYGKTETAIGQFIHLARAGHGCFFLDPHQDAITKIKPYLTTPGLRDRVIEIDLASTTGQQPGWNLFAHQPHAQARAGGQVDAVVDAFASALQWDERNTRALNLVTQATQALTELAARLPAELAPTLFQVPTLLGDDSWRAAILPHVSAPTRQFFTDRFPRLPGDAITPVTNLIDRLRVSPDVAGLLGNPESSYDIRRAMDEGLIVLACPGSGSARDRLVANFLVYDLLHAAKTRAHIPPDKRRPFHVFLDEVQTYDGASSGNLAALLEQTAKYGIRAWLLNQNPERLTSATLNAVTTNRSHLMSTALNAKAAALITREWAGAVEPETLTRLSRYTYLASVTLARDATPPFLVHGAPVEELHAGHAHPHRVPELAAAIDTTTRRVSVHDTLEQLATLDQRILTHLRTTTGPTSTVGGGGHGAYTLNHPGAGA